MWNTEDKCLKKRCCFIINTVATARPQTFIRILWGLTDTATLIQYKGFRCMPCLFGKVYITDIQIFTRQHLKGTFTNYKAPYKRFY